MSDQQTTSDHAPVLEATEARQAFRGRHVLWVLVISLVLVVLALFGAWASHAPALDRADKSEETAAPDAFNSPEPAAKQTAAQPAPANPR